MKEYTLTEFFYELDKDGLSELCEDIGIPCELDIKDAYISKLEDYFHNIDNFIMRMAVLNDDELQMARALVEADGIHVDGSNMHIAVRLINTRYFTLDNNHIYMMEEAKSLYSQVNLITFDTIRRVISGMNAVNYIVGVFYGAIPIMEYTKLYNSLYGTDLTNEQVLGYYNRIPRDLNPTILYDGYVVDEMLCWKEDFNERMARQYNGDYYMLSKDEYNQYIRHKYIADEECYNRLLQLLTDRAGNDIAEAFVVNLYNQLAMDYELLELLDKARIWGISVESEEDYRLFISLLVDAQYNTRLSRYNGYTLKEIAKKQGVKDPSANPSLVAKSTPMAKIIKVMEKELRGIGVNVDITSNATTTYVYRMPGGIEGEVHVSTKTLYPRDYCPCGSGKLYRYCCKKDNVTKKDK